MTGAPALRLAAWATGMSMAGACLIPQPGYTPVA